MQMLLPLPSRAHFFDTHKIFHPLHKPNTDAFCYLFLWNFFPLGFSFPFLHVLTGCSSKDHAQRVCLVTWLRIGAGETVQLLRALASLGEDLGLVSSTYMIAQNHLQLQFQGTWSLWAPGTHMVGI